MFAKKNPQRLSIHLFSDPTFSCRCTLRSRPSRQLRWTKRCLSDRSWAVFGRIFQHQLRNGFIAVQSTESFQWKYVWKCWWFGCHEFYFPIYWVAKSSQWTNSYFSEGWPNHQPVWSLLGYPRYRVVPWYATWTARASTEDPHHCDAVLGPSLNFAGAMLMCWVYLHCVTCGNMGLIGCFKMWNPGIQLVD